MNFHCIICGCGNGAEVERLTDRIVSFNRLSDWRWCFVWKIKSNWSWDLLGGLLVGGWGIERGTRLRGALAWWHFWMRAILWRRMGGCVYTKPALWDLNSWETPFKQSALLCELSKLIPANELNPWLLSHPFPLPLCPALPLGGWDAAIFAFYCII